MKKLKLFADPENKPNRDLVFFTECEKGLHSFYKTPYKNKSGALLCSCCKANAVDWSMLIEREPSKIPLVVNEVRKEWWRNYWWNMEIDEPAMTAAKSIGLEKVYVKVESRIKSSVGRVYDFKGQIKPYRDGYQTPYNGNVIFYAQHGMATCCRFCIEYWHGIPQGRDLTKEEIKYLSEITFFFIKKRLDNA